MIVNSVPHLLQIKDCDISTTSSVSNSGGMLANDEIEKKRTQQTLSSANRKGLSLVWIVVAIAIAAFRYFSS